MGNGKEGGKKHRLKSPITKTGEITALGSVQYFSRISYQGWVGLGWVTGGE